MNIAVGKVSDEARALIEQLGGRIEPSLKPSVLLITLPEHAEQLNSNALGAYIALPAPSEAVLYFTRAWHTEDCSIGLCGEQGGHDDDDSKAINEILE
jgi:hypothetical protein